ncbi:FAD-dependent oxidoreductase [Neisseriaceae bacterium ESL0693]|nr:FAD-dependent oxidoreductase [Neisseriaceae bacterium ESL0693]
MRKKFDVAILGGGLLGRLMAWRLARQGHRITLVSAGSREGEGAAAYIAAAMLAPAAEAIDGTALAVQLGYDSLGLWTQWIPQLSTPVFMQQNGTLVVWHAQDGALAQQFSQHLRRAHQGQTIWQDWQAEEISQAEPQLGHRFGRGLFLASEGQLDNRQVLLALANELDQSGVECHWHTTGTPENCAAQADWVLDCRGTGAKSSWNRQGQSQLRGVRGEVLRVYAPEISLNRPIRLLHPRYPLYIAPKQNHLFVIGATQLESEDDGPISVRSGLELMSALYAVHPAFGEARVLESATALRPTLNHENPEIRYDAGQRIVAMNGLFRHGFMIAPAVCEAGLQVLTALMQQQPLPEAAACHGIAVQAMLSE